MSAPVCRNGHHRVYCQRWRRQPWVLVDGELRPQFRCPVCGMFVLLRVRSHRARPFRWS